MDRQETMEKKNEIKTLDTGKCENVDTLYINKIIFLTKEAM